MAASSESQRLQSYSKLGLIFTGLALLLTLLCGWLATNPAVADIDHQKFENYHDSLQSYAHEGLFIAEQYEHTRAPANYTVVSSQKLHDAVSDLNTLLQTETPADGLEKDVQQAADQAIELEDVLSKLSQTAEQGGKSSASKQLRSIVEKLNQS
jgi:hypothetical protein